MNTASDVAKYIVFRFQQAGDPVSNLKLQKLLYYVQGWHLALCDRPAFNERLQAWVHGPVQSAVYGDYKAYRWNPISQPVDPVPQLEETVRNVTDQVLTVFGGESGYQLELRTHSEPPWLTARGGIPPDQESNAVISPESMAAYFKSLMVQ